MLRWIAPYLSFTAEEAWPILSPQASESIFIEKYWAFPQGVDSDLQQKWARILHLRQEVNKAVEIQREAGKIGSSLQAEVRLGLTTQDLSLVESLGDDAKFVFIVSQLHVEPATSLNIQVTPSPHTKCARCWHYVEDVGVDAAHPTICKRCVDNLSGHEEGRSYV
jgi:isoleucyl-tRNA synthetase